MFGRKKKVPVEPPTQKQLDYIHRLELETGYGARVPKTKSEASALIETLLEARDG